MSRRRLLLAAGVALALAPLAGRSQRAEKVARIGFVSPSPRGARNEAFVQALQDLGYVEGRNLLLEMRFAEGRPERLPALVEELVALNVAVLVVGATIGARAAKNATRTIPVVFAGSSDPVAGGILKDLARPERNLTGFSLAVGEGFAGKWLETLKQVLPEAARFAALWSSSNAAAAGFIRELEIAAKTLGIRLEAHDAANTAQLDQALAAIDGSVQGLIVTPSPFSATHQGRLVRFAADKRLPAIYFDEQFADAGGLMSYGPSIVDTYRRAAIYVDKILKGARPGDLPVQQPTRFDLVVNLRTARALGLRIPQLVLVRADRIIE